MSVRGAKTIAEYAIRTYLEQEGFLPVKINGQRKDQKLTVRLDISRSTQFLSAMLFCLR